uniref:GCR402 n=1 Tax=Schmidtea mediterranea TaxID=79327 RepID=A0A193KUW2_SCHMD|nr:GCR402 [Schmidtea mediterranea]
MNDTDSSVFRYSIAFITILGVSYGLILLMAIIGNLIVITTVLWHPCMKTVINILICNLSVADLLCAIFVLPMNFLQSITKEWLYGEILCRSTPYLQGVSVCTSIMTLTVVAFDRYVAICHPLHRILNISKATSIISMIWILSAILLLPWALYYRTEMDNNHTKIVCVQAWPDNADERDYFIFVIFIMCYIIPLFLISCFYFAIASRIYKRANANSNETQSKRIPLIKLSSGGISRTKSIRIVKMLAIVVVTFAVSWLPLYIVFIFLYYSDKNKWSPQFLNVLFDYLIPIFQLISASNSCINPWIYCLYSQTYRDGFRNVIICKKATLNDRTKTSLSISDKTRRITTNRVVTTV